MTIQPSPADSLTSPQYERRHPRYHVFYNPLTTGILSHADRIIACSNGLLYQTTDWPFLPEETYFREIKSEGEETSLVLDYASCSYNAHICSADSISENGYLDIVPQTATANWTITFKLENTLAGAYDVCAVVLPKSVDNPVTPDLRPCKFRAQLNYVDQQGEARSYNCGGSTFTSDPQRVDTVVLARGFQFPTCNYDQVNSKFSVRLTCNILARETASYAREMYLDCIYLRPSLKEEEQQ